MSCAHCDRENESDARFCAGCGAELAREPQRSSLADDVIDIAQRQGKIAAIKHHRQRTGTGLRESKEAVEALLKQRGVELPSGGCLGAVLLLAGLAVGSWLLTSSY